MGKFKRNCICLLLLIYPSLHLQAQNVVFVSATGHVMAEVIPVYSAVETAQLNFGRFSPGPMGGEIILSPESTINVLGSIHVGSGVHNAASFYISGDNDVSFTITLPTNPVVLKHISSSKTMTIEKWISKPINNPGSGILQNGEQTVLIGASLKVGTLNENPIGIYAGTYTITFEFN